ncbi:phosphatase PAP2 family protein [Streptomyces sp. NPDC050636]|uniref:phosphatase PAP2 family protein n=1 Tax=Streptomyces sp. NPDC050636 TaxID=3154510 RepID=UPI003424136F
MTKFPGLTKFPALAVGLLSVLLFATLTWQVACHGPLRTLDERLGRALAARAIPSWAAEFFADLGNTVVALPVLLAAVAWTAWHGRRRGPGRERDANDRAAAARWWLPPLAAALALATVPALVVPLKLWLARPGPPQMQGGTHDGFYPSGHGATAAVAYGVAALLLTHGRRYTGRPAGGALVPVALAAGVTVLNTGVGLGLVRQGYHWPLDVLGSWCLAGVILSVWWAVCARWAAAPPPVSPSASVGPPPRP